MVLIFAVLIAAAGAFFVRSARPQAAEAVVEADGKVIAAFPLGKDADYPINTEYGYNLVSVSGGRASVTDADCPDRLCVRQRAARNDGDRIICLPHRLVVYARSAGVGDADIVSG